MKGIGFEGSPFHRGTTGNVYMLIRRIIDSQDIIEGKEIFVICILIKITGAKLEKNYIDVKILDDFIKNHSLFFHKCFYAYC